MTLEELKAQWNQLSVRVDQLEQENRRLAGKLATGRATTAQQRLANHYFRHGLSGLILPLISPLIVMVLDMPLWIAVVYALFGIVCMVADIFFACYVRRSNFAVMPVVESLENMLIVKKKQRRLMITFVIMGGIFLGFVFFPALRDEPTVLVGAFIGLIVGLCIGIALYLRKVKLINEILKELRESII